MFAVQEQSNIQTRVLLAQLLERQKSMGEKMIKNHQDTMKFLVDKFEAVELR